MLTLTVDSGTLASSFSMVGWDFKDSQRIYEKVAALSNESIHSILSSASISRYIVLSTCNRFEIYYEGRGILESLPFEPQRYLSGQDALKHLFLVSSGLESLSLGENEILGQLKDAYEKALSENRSSSIMSTIFRKAISCGKDVRHRTGISAGRVSIPSFCGQVVYSTFRGNSKKISIIGTGKMSRDILKYVSEGKPDSISVYGRNMSSMEPIKEAFPEVKCLLMADMKSIISASDITIFATSSKKPLLFSSDFTPYQEGKAILDVSVPTNVDYSVDSLDGVKVMRLNDIEPVIRENMAWKKTLVSDAENIVEEHTESMLRKIRQLESEYLVAEIYNFARSVAEGEAEHYRHEITNGQDQEKALNALLNAIVNKLLHPQTAAIKDILKNNGSPSFISALMKHYRDNGKVTVSDYSEPEGQEDSQSRRAQIHRSNRKL